MKRILVIDDEAVVRDSVARLLKAADYEVSTADNGVKGLEKIKTSPPDLVIVDIMMPELDGVSLCHLMKKNPQTAHIPVVFLTGLDTIGAAENALKENPAGYITKPCEPSRLLQKIESLLGQ